MQKLETSRKIEFKKAAVRDIPLLKELIQKLYLYENISYSENDVNDALLVLINNGMHGAAWLIYLNNCIAGYLILTSAFSIEFKGETAFIDEIFIDDDFRGKGLGKAGVKFAEEYSIEKGYKALRLEVLSTRQ